MAAASANERGHAQFGVRPFQDTTFDIVQTDSGFLWGELGRYDRSWEYSAEVLVSPEGRVARAQVIRYHQWCGPDSFPPGTPAFVSLVTLLANPERWHMKPVFVTGYAHVKFEDCALYLDKASADYLIGSNAVWLDFCDTPAVELWTAESRKGRKQGPSLTEADCRFVRVGGVFNMHRHGHMGGCGGTIDGVRIVSVLGRWYDGAKELPMREQHPVMPLMDTMQYPLPKP